MADSSPQVSVIIPVFDGEHTIEKLASEIETALRDKYSYEVIFIFDRGREGSWAKIKEICQMQPEVIRAYSLAENRGQQRAILFGFTKASGTYIVTMDEDMQHHPGDIPLLIKRLEEGDCDIVYGKFISLKQPFLRRVFSALLRTAIALSINYLFRDYSPFRAIRSDIIKKIKDNRRAICFIDEMLCCITDRCGVIEITHHRCEGRKSSYSIRSLMHLALSAVLAFSYVSCILFVTGVLILVISGLTKGGFSLDIAGFILLAASLAGFITNSINRHKTRREIIVTESIINAVTQVQQ